MREIKFRAWDKKQNQMYDWKTLLECFLLDYAFCRRGFMLMQFTGLCAKNGDIYEDDVIKITDKNHTKTTWTSKVFFEDGAFRIFDKRDGEKEELRPYCKYWDVEIVGNIHQNPELLPK